jgi:hypothetical protein
VVARRIADVAGGGGGIGGQRCGERRDRTGAPTTSDFDIADEPIPDKSQCSSPSTRMRLGSWVIAKATDEIVEKGRKIAAAMMEAAEVDVEFARQRFLVKGPDRSIGLFEAATAAAGNGLPPDLRGPLVGIAIR